MNRHIVRFATLLTGALLLLLTSARAQEGQGYQYVAKFVCGHSPGKSVAPGTFFSAVNVHNPAEYPVKLRFKVATADGLEGGKISPFAGAGLKPDQALHLDCSEIAKRSGVTAAFLEGFVVIESESEMDVSVVYSASGPNRGVETMDVERIPGRRRTGCDGPDLIVESIASPTWDDVNHRTVIQAVIRNIGSAPAPESLARVIDPSTLQPTNVPYNDVQKTPALAPGASATITFYLPYWVYNPDASLDVTADYKNMVRECVENNNSKSFAGIG